MPSPLVAEHSSKRASFTMAVAAALLAAAMLLSPYAVAADLPADEEPAVAPKTIEFVEFGWGMPSAAFVAKNLAAMEEQPFNGVVLKPIDGDFHPGAGGAPHLFDDRRWTEAQVGLDDFRKLDLANSGLPASFLTLECTRPDPDVPDPAGWLSDERWDTIIANLRLYAQARKAANARGFWFDEEAYVADPWTFSPELYPGQTLDQVKAAVRMRGAQMIDALESAGGPIDLIFIFGLCAWHIDSEDNTLMFAFYDGMLDAIDPTTRLIDGNENAYYQQTTEELTLFRKAQLQAHERLSPENRAKYIQHRGTAHGMYADILAAPETFVGYPFFTRRVSCHVVPVDQSAFTQWAIYNTARMAEDYVWLWTEQFEWWRPQGQRDTSRAKLDVPPWFREAWTSAQQRVRDGNPPEPIPHILGPAVERRDAFMAERGTQ